MLYLLIRFFKQNYDIKNIILDEGEIMMKKLTDFIKSGTKIKLY